MSRILVYHNGECSKCKELTEILPAKVLPVDYKFYLHEPLTITELKVLLQKLQLPATALLRQSEPLFAAQYEGKQFTDDEWLQIIVDHPVLLQRPIVVFDDKAIIARPPAKVLEIL